MSEIKFDRIWTMPNKWTFSIPYVKDLLKEEIGTDEWWVDPFCGIYSPAEIRNDLNPEINADFNLDALEFLKRMPSSTFNGILYDPPYSISQASECYKNFGKEKLEVNVSNMKYWASCKNEIVRILKPNSKAICFGWSSMGLGKNRGFEMKKIILMAHGGSKNDTIITIERKVQ